MTTWNEFAVPKSSFERPVPLVFVDPDDNPNVQVCFRSEWMPYVLGALMQLTLQTTWKSTDKDEVQQQQARARLLIEQFMVGCPTPIPSVGCIAFPMSASFISYYPQNPYTQPAYIPDWYSALPLIVAEGSIVTDLLGLADGDVIALPGSFPNLDAIVEKGLTAIHLDLVGQGQVELHMVMFPEGSLAVITIDGDLLGSIDVDLNADIIELPAESPGEIIKEFNFTTDGAHTIDIRFTPVLDDSGIPLRYGGGMRSVVLCGFDATVGDTMFDVRQNSELPCKLEKTIDGGTTWTQWADLLLCPPDLIEDGGIIKIKRGGSYVPIDGVGGYDEREDGTYTPPWPPETVPSGQSGNCLAAENIVAFLVSSLTQVKQGLDISTPVSTTMGIVAGTIGFLGFISAGVFAAVGLIIAGLLSALGSAGINDMLTDGTMDTLKCILYSHLESDGSCTSAEFTAIYAAVGTDIPGVKGEIIQNWLNGFGPVGLSRQGHAGDITSSDCSACPSDWTYHFDFRTSQYGWLIGGRDTGSPTGNTTWVEGEGFKSIAHPEILNSGVIEVWLEGYNRNEWTIRMVGDPVAGYSGNGIYTAPDGSYPTEAACTAWWTSAESPFDETGPTLHSVGVGDIQLRLFAPYSEVYIYLTDCYISGVGVNPFI